jgi:hypothetical protein
VKELNRETLGFRTPEEQASFESELRPLKEAALKLRVGEERTSETPRLWPALDFVAPRQAAVRLNSMVMIAPE